MNKKVKIEVKGETIKLTFDNQEMFHITAFEIRDMRRKLRKLHDKCLEIDGILSGD